MIPFDYRQQTDRFERKQWVGSGNIGNTCPGAAPTTNARCLLWGMP